MRVITRADGVYLWDSEGNKIIDAMSGLWCVQVGYGNEELAEAGCEALKTLPYYNHFFKTANPYTVELAAKLASASARGPRPCAVRQFRIGGERFRAQADPLLLEPERQAGQEDPSVARLRLSRRDLGRGIALRADADASAMGFAAARVSRRCPRPTGSAPRRPDMAISIRKNSGFSSRRRLEDKILELGAGNVASFSAEPIQGAGGVIFPPASYWPEVQRICAKYDVLLHLDEVITGFGRTGEWFGADTYAIAADIMTMAKGLSSGYQPISAISLGSAHGARPSCPPMRNWCMATPIPAIRWQARWR